MRFALGCALALVAMPAMACNDQLFSVTDWRASAEESGRHIRTEVEVDLVYEGEAAYRMIHAATLFSDVMGNALVSVQIERDTAVEPNAELTSRSVFLSSTSRIASIHRDDVVSRSCVWTIVYDDGTVERFDQ